MTKIRLGRQEFIWLIHPCPSQSLREAWIGNQDTSLEAEAKGKAMELLTGLLLCSYTTQDSLLRVMPPVAGWALLYQLLI